MALLFIDLDGFKQVNDTHGHDAGDAILISVSKRLKESTRETDTVARLGGDEFVILMTDLSNIKDCESKCQHIIQSVSEPISWSGLSLKVGASIGVSIYDGDERTYQDLIKESDEAMYLVKQKGKGTYQLHSSYTDITPPQNRTNQG